MKYGEHLRMSIAPEYGPEPYIDYEKLDGIIRQLSEKAPARYEHKTHASTVQYGSLDWSFPATGITLSLTSLIHSLFVIQS
jgi:SPX domain protein involved in polyphosphate accumulation